MILGGLCVLAILVIVAIVLSVVLVSKSSDNSVELELDDILRGRLVPRSFDGTWIDDESYYYFEKNVKTISYYDFISLIKLINTSL